MPLLRPSLSLSAPNAASATRASARASLALRSNAPPFPVIPTCPEPSCRCSPMPVDLDIDQSQSLNGSMAPYAQHLVISTGRSDWTSKIEDERETAVWGKFTAEMKTLLGRRGDFHDPFNNVLLSASSFAPVDHSPEDTTIPSTSASGYVDAVLFPGFQHFRHLVPDMGGGEDSSIRSFIRSFLLPETLHPMYDGLPQDQRQAKLRTADAGKHLHRQIQNPTILICSHGQRDHRCGVMGPLLHAEFTNYIDQIPHGDAMRLIASPAGRFLPASDESTTTGLSHAADQAYTRHVNIGMISHVGGHKWAGNVILYIPPTFPGWQPSPHSSSPVRHPLAGAGIWYGRVEPRHVQGIVEQTLLRGKVIEDLFRGGISATGGVLRL